MAEHRGLDPQRNQSSIRFRGGPGPRPFGAPGDDGGARRSRPPTPAASLRFQGGPDPRSVHTPSVWSQGLDLHQERRAHEAQAAAVPLENENTIGRNATSAITLFGVRHSSERPHRGALQGPRSCFETTMDDWSATVDSNGMARPAERLLLARQALSRDELKAPLSVGSQGFEAITMAPARSAD